jgi:hypothetical protein
MNQPQAPACLAAVLFDYLAASGAVVDLETMSWQGEGGVLVQHHVGACRCMLRCFSTSLPWLAKRCVILL